MTPELSKSVTVHKAWASDDDVAEVRDLAITFRHRFEPTGMMLSRDFRKAELILLQKHRDLFNSETLTTLWKRIEDQAAKDYDAFDWTIPFKRADPVLPQITMSGDGDFFRAHTDNGNRSRPRLFTRTVTYILYCGGNWSGGDLVLHPTILRDGSGVPTQGERFRVTPEQGDLVVFPSFLRHEIEDVKCSGEWEDGRLTLNGWIHREPQDGSIVSRALRRAKIGDKVAAATAAIGIKPCGGCKRRKRILNGEEV